MKWRWVSRAATLAIHNEQIAEHGGKPGIRDVGMLESALDRPRNLAGYKDANAAELAASCAFGLIRNHPFFDGNKRTGFLVSSTFLLLNGYTLSASEKEVVEIFLRLAAGDMTEEKLSYWFHRHIKK